MGGHEWHLFKAEFSSPEARFFDLSIPEPGARVLFTTSDSSENGKVFQFNSFLRTGYVEGKLLK